MWEQAWFQSAEKSVALFYPGGCDRCRQTGYRGRIAIHEVLPVNNVLKDKIFRRASEEELWNAAQNEFPNLTTLQEDGIGKVRNGLTSAQELLHVLGV